MLHHALSCFVADCTASRQVNIPFVSSFPCVLCAAGPESRDLLWYKSKFAWLKAYHEELSSYDWFIRGDDDTYLVGCVDL